MRASAAARSPTLKVEIERTLKEGEAELDQLTQKIVAAGLASWSGGESDERKLIVRGQAHLLEDLKALADLERVRLLVRRSRNPARGDRSAWAAPSRPRACASSSVRRTSCFRSPARRPSWRRTTMPSGHIVGVLGVIGPTRLNYARIVPMVDYTAKVVSKLLCRLTLPKARRMPLALDFCRVSPDMRGSKTMGKDMTEQTARAEDEAAEQPEEAAAPADPGPRTARSGCGSDRVEGPAVADARRDGKSAQAHRARSRRCAALWRYARLRAIFSALPIICAARSMRWRPNCAPARKPT